MSERSDWQDLRDRRMAEPGAAEAYEHARLAYELDAPIVRCANRRASEAVVLQEVQP